VGPDPGVIRFGVAGWDYPDWNGVVYPAHPSARFDRLAYLASFVDAVEINGTFYRPASPRTAASWAQRTSHRAGFRFTAKAHRSWTHDPLVDLATAVPETLRGLEPLRESGSLGALLVQFPQRFHRDADSVAHLSRLLDRVVGWPVVVEVRHASWDAEDAEKLFRDRGVGWCVVDQPAIRGTAPARPRVTAPLAYLRLHGRNAADWFRESAGRDARYDYLYSPEELQGVAATARRLASQSAELFVVQNNHFRGKALVNTLQLKRLIEGGRPAAPADLVRAYPQLEEAVTEDQSRLF
jgi:uncharacterized protein YecE (DUF72 family)